MIPVNLQKQCGMWTHVTGAERYRTFNPTCYEDAEGDAHYKNLIRTYRFRFLTAEIKCFLFNSTKLGKKSNYLCFYPFCH